MITACDRDISATTNKTIIVPGRGAVSNRDQLIEFRGMPETVYKRVSGIRKQG